MGLANVHHICTHCGVVDSTTDLDSRQAGLILYLAMETQGMLGAHQELTCGLQLAHPCCKG